jgi:hypothetical protein
LANVAGDFLRTLFIRYKVRASFKHIFLCLTMVWFVTLSGCSLIKPVEIKPVEIKPVEKACPVFVEKACPVCIEKVCPEPAKRSKASALTARGELNLPVIGEVEYVTVNPSNIKFEARIDTGAKSSSLHVEDVQLIEREGKPYARFSLFNKKTNKMLTLERPLIRKVLIKQTSGEVERRLVVKLWLTLGKSKDEVDVTLSDRTGFEFPLLIGRNLLTDRAIVDVRLRHTLRN